MRNMQKCGPMRIEKIGAWPALICTLQKKDLGLGFVARQSLANQILFIIMEFSYFNVR